MLVGNGVYLHGGPLTILGGNTLPSITQGRWTGGNRGFEDAFGNALAARPDGTYPPVSWLMPRQGGAVASYKALAGVGQLDAHAAAGLAASADMTGAGSLAAAGSLLAWAICALEGSGDLSATARGYIEAAAALAGAGALTASIRALGYAVADMTGSGDLQAIVKGIGRVSVDLAGSGDLAGSFSLIASVAAALQGSGELTAEVSAMLSAAVDLAGSGDLAGAVNAIGHAVTGLTGSGTLVGTLKAIGHASADLTVCDAGGGPPSAAQIAAEVWSTVAAAFNAGGTMGEALNVSQIMLRNKTVTDPVAGTITVYDADGVTVLYVAPLWQDAAGTIPYAGEGAERRERLQ